MPDLDDQPTAAQLKDDINSGRTRDKVPIFDPSAAPLGTDDEAAGTPPSAHQVSHARDQEVQRPAQPSAVQDRPPPARWSLWLWGGASLILVVAVLFLMQ